MPNRIWRTEPFSGSKLRDELWIGVKSQTNPEIAGSPRNAFRCSPWTFKRCGGRALDRLAAARLANRIKPRMPHTYLPGSETVGAKFHGREGNNPDRQLRPLIPGLVSNDVRLPRQPGGWLRSSHP